VLSDDSRTKITELLLTSKNVMREILEHRVSWLLCPVLAGLGMTVLTWYVIYTDSCIPGVKPPTPFSPTKNRYVCLRRAFLFNVRLAVSKSSSLPVVSSCLSAKW
jgi:hypothetical protein